MSNTNFHGNFLLIFFTGIEKFAAVLRIIFFLSLFYADRWLKLNHVLTKMINNLNTMFMLFCAPNTIRLRFFRSICKTLRRKKENAMHIHLGSRDEQNKFLSTSITIICLYIFYIQVILLSFTFHRCASDMGLRWCLFSNERSKLIPFFMRSYVIYRVHGMRLHWEFFAFAPLFVLEMRFPTPTRKIIPL